MSFVITGAVILGWILLTDAWQFASAHPDILRPIGGLVLLAWLVGIFWETCRRATTR